MSVHPATSPDDGAPAGKACPVCRTPATSTFTARGVHPGGSGVRFHCCPTCGLRFQEVSPEEDGSIYTQVEVAREERGQGGGPSLVLDRDALEHLRRLAPGPRLLDVGSGDGRFLQAAVAGGFTATGTDISPELATQAQARSGCEVRVGVLPELRLPGDSFDAVNLDLVLMYVPEPVPLVQEVSRLLSPGGICRVRECFADSLNARMQRDRWWFYCDSTLRVYTRRSLECLARQAKLRPLRWYAGTEVSLATWSAYAVRKKNRSLGKQLLQFVLKHGSLGGIPLAGDGTCYLQKH